MTSRAREREREQGFARVVRQALNDYPVGLMVQRQTQLRGGVVVIVRAGASTYRLTIEEIAYDGDDQS